MARPRLFRSKDVFYHVSVRSNNREWFYIPPNKCWQILTESLAEIVVRSGSEICTLVQMSNHLHMLLRTPNLDLGEVMRDFLSKATRHIQKEANRINHVFGARYKWSVLENPYAFAYVYKYVLRNPVRAGMVDRVEDYPWSTLNDVNTTLPLSEGTDHFCKYIPKEPKERLRWLNTPAPREAEALVGRALRRYQFKFSTDHNVRSSLKKLRQHYLVESDLEKSSLS